MSNIKRNKENHLYVFLTDFEEVDCSATGENTSTDLQDGGCEPEVVFLRVFRFGLVVLLLFWTVRDHLFEFHPLTRWLVVAPTQCPPREEVIWQCPRLVWNVLSLQALNLDNLKSHHWSIYGCSAVTGNNLLQGIDWLIDDISSRIFTADW